MTVLQEAAKDLQPFPIALQNFSSFAPRVIFIDVKNKLNLEHEFIYNSKDYKISNDIQKIIDNLSEI